MNDERGDALAYLWGQAADLEQRGRSEAAEAFWALADQWLARHGHEQGDDPFQRCDHACPGNRPCCCNALVVHERHICSWSGCLCHDLDRYEGKQPWGE